MANLAHTVVNIKKSITNEIPSVATGATLGVVAGNLAQGDLNQTAWLLAATGMTSMLGVFSKEATSAGVIALCIAAAEASSSNPDALGQGIPGATLAVASGFVATELGLAVAHADSFKEIRESLTLKPLLASAAFAAAVSGALNFSLPQETAPVAPVQQNHQAVTSVPVAQPVLYAVNAKLG